MFVVQNKFTNTTAHEEALARCEFLIQHRRCWGLIAGPAGTGKSTLLQQLRAGARKQLGTPAVLLDATAADDRRLLSEIADGLGLGLSHRASSELQTAIRDRLAGQSQCEERRLVLIDHLEAAQTSLFPALAHLLRVTSTCGSLTIISAARTPIAAGVRELEEDFGAVHIELPPLGRADVEAYTRGALKSRRQHERSFDLDAFDALHGLCRGVPRQIDRLCELALLARDVEQADSVSAELLAAVAREAPAYSETAPA